MTQGYVTNEMEIARLAQPLFPQAVGACRRRLASAGRPSPWSFENVSLLRYLAAFTFINMRLRSSLLVRCVLYFKMS